MERLPAGTSTCPQGVAWCNTRHGPHGEHQGVVLTVPLRSPWDNEPGPTLQIVLKGMTAEWPVVGYTLIQPPKAGGVPVQLSGIARWDQASNIRDVLDTLLRENAGEDYEAINPPIPDEPGSQFAEALRGIFEKGSPW